MNQDVRNDQARPTPSQQEDEIDYKSLALEQALNIARIYRNGMDKADAKRIDAAINQQLGEK